ncbi:MAG: 50S ribosomal protein L23 [Patescibacteria group bacterium]|jgi:large subunit ribosomal protein L23
MGLFNKKTEEKKQPVVKTAKVSNDKKIEKTEVEAKSMKDLYGGAETEKVKQSAKGVTKKIAHGNAYKIIMKPLVTEKVSDLGALNKYAFAVAKNANKIEVAKAIKEIYGIKPVGVNVIRMSGKKARYGRITGKRKDWKKAIITLPKGQTIKIYEGV